MWPRVAFRALPHPSGTHQEVVWGVGLVSWAPAALCPDWQFHYVDLNATLPNSRARKAMCSYEETKGLEDLHRAIS